MPWRKGRRGKPGRGGAVCPGCKDLFDNAELVEILAPGKRRGVFYCRPCGDFRLSKVR